MFSSSPALYIDFTFSEQGYMCASGAEDDHAADLKTKLTEVRVYVRQNLREAIK